MRFPGLAGYNSILMDVQELIGRAPDRLTITERESLAGKWFATELYSPATTPLRRIEAVGDSVAACVAQLKARGLDPKQYEFQPLMLAY